MKKIFIIVSLTMFLFASNSDLNKLQKEFSDKINGSNASDSNTTKINNTDKKSSAKKQKKDVPNTNKVVKKDQNSISAKTDNVDKKSSVKKQKKDVPNTNKMVKKDQNNTSAKTDNVDKKSTTKNDKKIIPKDAKDKKIYNTDEIDNKGNGKNKSKKTNATSYQSKIIAEMKKNAEKNAVKPKAKKEDNPFTRSTTLKYKVVPLKDVNYNFIEYQKLKKSKKVVSIRPSKKYTAKELLLERYKSIKLPNGAIAISKNEALLFSKKQLKNYKFHDHVKNIYVLKGSYKKYYPLEEVKIGKIYLIKDNNIVESMVKYKSSPLLDVDKSKIKDGMVVMQGCCSVVGIIAGGKIITQKRLGDLLLGIAHEDKVFYLDRNLVVRKVRDEYLSHYINPGDKIIAINYLSVHNLLDYERLMYGKAPLECITVNNHGKEMTVSLTGGITNELKKSSTKKAKNVKIYKIFEGLYVNDNMAVARITGDSKAALLGIKKGDKILEIDGNGTSNSSSLLKYIKLHKKQEYFDLLLQRDGFQFFIKYSNDRSK